MLYDAYLVKDPIIRYMKLCNFLFIYKLGKKFMERSSMDRDYMDMTFKS